MQALLTDIELDIQELKCLMDAFSREPNGALRGVLRRNIQQMSVRLNTLLLQLNVVQPTQDPVQIASKTDTPPLCPEILIAKEEPIEEPPTVEEVSLTTSAPILAERIKTAVDLRRSISLNDSFRFSRELFDGDGEQMNRVLQQIGEMNSYAAALSFLHSKVQANEESEAMVDLLELLKKYFN